MNYLAGDLGGTKTLLAIFDSDNKRLPNKIYQQKYLSKNWGSFDLIISDFIKKIPKNINPPCYGCLGVAGQVSNNSCKITNLDWRLKSETICRLSGLKSVELINDFSEF